MAKSNQVYRSTLVQAGLSALLVGAALWSAQAQADNYEVRQVRVRYSELDVSKQAGAQVLYRRLRSAAQRVCDNSTSFRFHRRIDQACYHKALTDAVIQVNAPMVSELHGLQTERLAAKKP